MTQIAAAAAAATSQNRARPRRVTTALTRLSAPLGAVPGAPFRASNGAESSSASWLVFEEKRDASTRASRSSSFPTQYANDATHATEYPKTLTRLSRLGSTNVSESTIVATSLNGAAHAASNALPARTKQ